MPFFAAALSSCKRIFTSGRFVIIALRKCAPTARTAAPAIRIGTNIRIFSLFVPETEKNPSRIFMLNPMQQPMIRNIPNHTLTDFANI